MLRVSHIVEIFEKPDYKEDNPETGAKVVTLMNEVSPNHFDYMSI